MLLSVAFSLIFLMNIRTFLGDRASTSEYVVMIDVMICDHWLLMFDIDYFRPGAVAALSILMLVVSGYSRQVGPVRSGTVCYIYDDMLLYLVIFMILLSSVSSRVLFDLQIKVKTMWTNHELGGRVRLYMWVGLDGS
jgi:hypothetical protein